MADKTTKILLAVIALGLWANFAVAILRPSIAAAEDADLSNIESALSGIQADVSSLERIARGVCPNGRLC
jgi:hypothetical protein